MTLAEGRKNTAYTIGSVNAAHEEGMKEFLFTLGCFPGEEITIVSHLSSNYVINVKNARYSIDESLARAIEVNIMGEEKKIV